MRRARRGFTLVEMLVGVGLFFILASILMALLWTVWRGFATGVAKAQALSAANLLLEKIGQDVANAQLRRADDLDQSEEGYAFPVTARNGDARTARPVKWSLVAERDGGNTVKRDGARVNIAGILAIDLEAVTLAGPIAIDVEAQDPNGRARVRLRKLVEVPLLRQRARFAPEWEAPPNVSTEAAAEPGTGS